jgi:hypothetical protein
MNKKKATIIIVNGREEEYFEKDISFVDVIKLAFGTYDDNLSIAYTVTYSINNKDGVLVLGDSIKVHKGAIFNATRTDKS